jgi:hypothetical protein
MTISTTDIKLRTPERLTDLADGGGRQTSGTIVDTSRLDLASSSRQRGAEVLHY